MRVANANLFSGTSSTLNKKRTVVDHLLQDEGAASEGGSFLRTREAR